jgi:hypothetical protein
VGRPPRGRSWSLVKGREFFYERRIYYETNMGARQNIYFGRHFACLKYFTYRLVPDWLLTISSTFLSPAKVRKVC